MIGAKGEGEGRDDAVGGLAERFRFFRGASGRRHVFTRNEAPFESDDFEGAVVLAIRRDRAGAIAAVRIACDRVPEGAVGAEIWVHFLAMSRRERAAVAVDLAGARLVEDDAEAIVARRGVA